MSPTTASDEDVTDVEVEGRDEEQVPAHVATRAAPRKKVTRTHRQYNKATVKPRGRGRKGKTVPKEGSVRFGIIYLVFFISFNN